jgi:hypothetical protein
MQKTFLILSKNKTTTDKPWLQVFSGITKHTQRLSERLPGADAQA